MGNVPTTVNGTAETINGVLKTVVGTGVDAARAAAVAEVPILGAPIISTLFGALLGWLSGYLYKALANYSTFLVIDMQTGNELDHFNQAAAALKAAQSGGDSNAIDQARLDFKNKLASLIHFDGSATP